MWSDSQVNLFVKQLKGTWSKHWHLMPEEFRTAVVDQKVLSVVVGQDRESVQIAAIDDLRSRLHTGMGT